VLQFIDEDGTTPPDGTWNCRLFVDREKGVVGVMGPKDGTNKWQVPLKDLEEAVEESQKTTA
jgi:hypothetical protein